MKKFTWRWYLALATVIVAAAAAARQYWQAPNTVSQTATLPIAYTAPPPGLGTVCSVADTAMVRERGLDLDAINFAQSNGYYGWCIPEYDDDQRLSDGKSNSVDYGPIAHVLGKPTLADLNSTSQFDGQYVQVAIVDLETKEPSTLGTYSTYSGLGLSAHNCLYLQHHSKVGGLSEWYTAVIVPPVTEPYCPTSPLESASKQLVVKVESPSPNGADYPATTRFVEGPPGQVLIGVKCADRWCLVGPQGFDAVPASEHDTVDALKTKAQGYVKGWFDDQMLGVPGTGQFGIHRQIRASAIPDAGLGSLKVADFVVNGGGVVPPDTEKYQIVGKVHFAGDPPPDSKYVSVFGFSKGTNVVALRAQIHMVPRVDTVWYAQVTDAKGNVKSDIKTHRMDHHKIDQSGLPIVLNVPATLRWRWFDSDEDLWVECDIGCCLINGRQ